MRGEGVRGEIMIGRERTGRERDSLISPCDTPDYSGASRCNILFY